MASSYASVTETIRVGFTYDSKATWMTLGFTAEEYAEYDDDETIVNVRAQR